MLIHRSLIRMVGAIVATAFLAACGGSASNAPQVPAVPAAHTLVAANGDRVQGHNRHIRVMTYNVDEGTDYTELLNAHTTAAFLLAVGTTITNVRATDPPSRMSALARQILLEKPDLINLQEISLWSTGSFNPSTRTCGPVAPEFDMLQELLDSLTQQGGHYDLVIQTPLITVPPTPALIPPSTFFCGAVTNRIAMLARSAPDDDGARFTLSNVQAGQYQNKLFITTPVATLPEPRAWVSADVDLGENSFRFIGTHLESFSDSVRELQGAELRNGRANTLLPVVIAMDSNATANPPPVDPTYTDFITAGFADVWTELHPSDPGPTCCQAPLVNNPVSQLDHRIDLILTHGRFKAQQIERVGIDASSWTPSGLWPSDHAGVFAKLGFDKGDD